MDDLAQYSPRRRALPPRDPVLPIPGIVFSLAPRVPLARRSHDPHAWRRRLG